MSTIPVTSSSFGLGRTSSASNNSNSNSTGRNVLPSGATGVYRHSGGPVMEPKRVVDAIELLELGESSTFNMCLSILMQKTSDSDPEVVFLEQYYRMLPSLVKILDGVNPLKGVFLQNLLAAVRENGQTLPHDGDIGNIMSAVDMLSSSKVLETWPNHDLPCVDDEVFKNVARSVDCNKVLLSVLTIIRNVSFEVNNCIILAYSTNLVVHLISLMMPMRTNGYISDSCRLALDILSNIGHRIDILGNKRAFHTLHSADISYHYATRGVAMKPVAGLQMPALPPVGPSVVRGATCARSCMSTYEDSFLYALSTKCLIAVLVSLLSSSERQLVVRSLELLSQIALVPENAPVFNCMPPTIVSEIADLFYTNISSSDPLRLFSDNSVYNPSVPPNSLKLPPAAVTHDFFRGLSDGELRDIVIDTVNSLCAHAITLRERFGSVPNLISCLIRFFESESTAISTSHRRDITPQRVGAVRTTYNLLSTLASHSANKDKFMVNQLQLCSMAFSDDFIAEIMCSHAKLFQQPINNTINAADADQ